MTEEIVIEMSWTRAVPLLLEVYHNAETPKARHEAKDELMRCAAIADDAVLLHKRLEAGTISKSTIGGHPVVVIDVETHEEANALAQLLTTPVVSDDTSSAEATA